LQDQAADSIAKAFPDGKLPNPFNAKQIRDIFGPEFNKNYPSIIPFEYCTDGKYVKIGRSLSIP
jgi:hypothetical protein